ncbi:uncharacterized protein Z519_10661 [Cladophialophora bantiana CBS 173.52]|uniref:BZIP domain-containing protein n=1 Tax=Cladophialophora bantiana (strain ATCC 10958 / CBS 173.52 / CDC B-1940 / NIH 8579) TaxID=1442370 RepID=A0A0D2HCI7_CLAB1|nr:uncharacterized protein Z519_10661 [Cladophialophora bantiana CBS 173.52]KIW88615.1 hypothetical protein Z519_10661 [Cladophialophora bantiana CBS 173.52]
MGPNTSRHPAAQYASVVPQADRRISTSSEGASPPGEMHAGETAEMRERRRAQNRLAQQAFRARQKVRVEALENEWAQLRQLHEALNQACSQRAKEIKQLESRVEELLHNIQLLKSSQEIERNWSSSPTTPEQQQYTQASAVTVAEADLRNFFSGGGLSELPDFPPSFKSY